MHSEGDQVHVSEEEASAGSKEGVVRWVLIIGTLLAVVTLSVIWITGAAVRDDPDADYASVDSKIQAQDEHIGKPLPAQTSDKQEVRNGLPVVNN
jgi:hypothetical protein